MGGHPGGEQQRLHGIYRFFLMTSFLRGRVEGVTGGSRTLIPTMEPRFSAWRVCHFHHGDVRQCRRRDSNPHHTQILRLRPLPVGPRRQIRLRRERVRAGGFEPPVLPSRTECSSQVEPCADERQGPRWTSRESHPDSLFARQRSSLEDKPMIRAARRDCTCLLLLVEQAQSLDCQCRVKRDGEPRGNRTLARRVAAGDPRPRIGSWYEQRELHPHHRFGRPRSFC